MRRLAYAAALVAGVSTSGCAALLGAGAGAAAVACTDDDIECPAGGAVDDVANMVDRPLISGTNAGLFDTDGDGLFERAEYVVYGDKNFSVWDANRDGLIDMKEFGSGWNAIGWDDEVGAFEAFDDDMDGFLRTNEFFDDDEFGAWDDDRDGVLNDDEWF